MNLDFTQEQEQFREKVQTWLHENMPTEERVEGTEEGKAFDLAWQKKLYEGGWAGINWPKEYGGTGFRYVPAINLFNGVCQVWCPRRSLPL